MIQTAFPTPTPPTEIDIRDFRKLPSMVAERMGKFDILFSYFIGAEGPFTITLPAEAIEGKTEVEQDRIVREAIMREQGERLRWVGRKIKI